MVASSSSIEQRLVEQRPPLFPLPYPTRGSCTCRCTIPTALHMHAHTPFPQILSAGGPYCRPPPQWTAPALKPLLAPTPNPPNNMKSISEHMRTGGTHDHCMTIHDQCSATQRRQFPVRSLEDADREKKQESMTSKNRGPRIAVLAQRRRGMLHSKPPTPCALPAAKCWAGRRMACGREPAGFALPPIIKNKCGRPHCLREICMGELASPMRCSWQSLHLGLKSHTSHLHSVANQHTVTNPIKGLSACLCTGG